MVCKKSLLLTVVAAQLIATEGTRPLEVPITEEWQTWVLNDLLFACAQDLGPVFEVEATEGKLTLNVEQESFEEVKSWLTSAKTLFHASDAFVRLHDPEIQKCIADLIFGMAETDTWKLTLPAYRKPLENLSNRLKKVPPLQVLGGAVATPKLRKALASILNSTVKRYSFMERMGPKLQREKDAGILTDDMIRSFAVQVEANPQELLKCAHAEDWVAFVKALAKV